jgi:Ser/Thr protein kinase RdoA (MazF antagonist)
VTASRRTHRAGGVVVKAYRDPAIAARAAAILEQLERLGVPAPRLVHIASTEVAMTDVGEPSDDTSAEVYRVLGELAGRLHATPAAGMPEATFSLANERVRAATTLELARAHRLEHLELIEGELLAAFAELADLDALPRGLIHTDIGPHNSVVDARGVRTLVDWDDAGLGACVIDIGYTLVHAAVDIESGEPRWLPERARAFLAGYSTHRTLTAAELAALPDAMALGSLIYVIADWVPAIHVREWARASWVRAHLGDGLLL